MIDRNELEDQLLKNLAALGQGNLEHASSIARLNKLLRGDYRGIIVTMIHKFRDMPADLNTRSNIYVLIDEAHRTTSGCRSCGWLCAPCATSGPRVRGRATSISVLNCLNSTRRCGIT